MENEFNLLVNSDLEFIPARVFSKFVMNNFKYFFIKRKITIVYSSINFNIYNEMIEERKKGNYIGIIDFYAEAGFITTNSVMLLTEIKNLIKYFRNKQRILSIRLYEIDDANGLSYLADNSLSNKIWPQYLKKYHEHNKHLFL